MEVLDNKKPKILITDGDADNQKFLKLFLSKYFIVTVCDSAEAVYNHLQNDNYDLIILEIALRGKTNGLELASELKKNPKYSHIPILCYTGYAFHQDRINALEAGCEKYLSKPTDIRILLSTLFNMLKGKNFSFDEQLINNICFSQL
ncbi:response regulator [Rosettibacter firmus]|uniref:response regulator n=1 Tax=Rosettibacter firmus TaxID=3111522 RepID=UPI00336BE1C1